MSKKFNYREIAKNFSFFGTIGLTIIINLFLFILCYKMIAYYFFESNILFIIFMILGVISGFYNIYRMIIKK